MTVLQGSGKEATSFRISNVCCSAQRLRNHSKVRVATSPGRMPASRTSSLSGERRGLAASGNQCKDLSPPSPLPALSLGLGLRILPIPPRSGAPASEQVLPLPRARGGRSATESSFRVCPAPAQRGEPLPGTAILIGTNFLERFLSSW